MRGPLRALDDAGHVVDDTVGTRLAGLFLFLALGAVMAAVAWIANAVAPQSVVSDWLSENWGAGVGILAAIWFFYSIGRWFLEMFRLSAMDAERASKSDQE